MRGILLASFMAGTALVASCSSHQTYPIFPAEVTDANTNTYDRAFAFHNGRGIPRDYERAAALYAEAAARGDARAENNLGVMALRGQGRNVSYWAASSHFKRAADAGSAAAHYNLGLMYDSGIGAGKNQSMAVRQYRMAAEQGLAEAQVRLAVLVANGIGTPANQAEAQRLLEMAAVRGDADGHRRLGALQNVALSDAETVKQVLAVEHCGDCGTDSNVTAMAARDYSGLAKMAEQGDASARYNLGVRMLNGNHAVQDPSEAARLFTLAARDGYAPAQRQLAQMHLRGQGVARSKVLAHVWLNMAAKQGGNEARIAEAQMVELEVSMTTSEIAQAQDIASSGDYKGR